MTETAYYKINHNLCDTYLFFAKYSKLVNEPEHLGKILHISLDVLFQLQDNRQRTPLKKEEEILTFRLTLQIIRRIKKPEVKFNSKH